MSAVILLRFDEATKLMPSDTLANLADLQTVGLTAPSRVSAWAGFGRRFVQISSHGFVAADLSGKGTLLQRDATIQVLISLTLTGASGPQTIIARGVNDGPVSERYAYGLEVQEQPSFPGFVEVRWFWQDSTGAIKTQAPGVFRHPGDGVEFMLTATRRWESTSRVVVRYYVADQLIAELVSLDGDISGGTTGRTTIGMRKTAGADGRFLNGTIDELLVLESELSAEEIRHTWKRLSEYQPGGVETLLGLTPPGATWSKDPGNDIGRLIKVAGQLLGLGVAGAEEVRALTLPDAAPLELAERWERICELAAGPVDSLDVRRARLLAFLAREQAFDVPAIQVALSGPFGLAPMNVQILEFTNTITDDFAATQLNSRWLDGTGNNGAPSGVWSATGGQLHATLAAGIDARWESQAAPHLVTPREPRRLFLQGAIASLTSTALASSVFAGVVLQNRATSDTLWFGIYNDAGTPKIVWRTSQAGQDGAINVLTAIAFGSAVRLRIATSQAASWIDNGSLTVSYALGSGAFTDTTINTGITSGWYWAGFALFSTVASTPAATAVGFDEFLVHDADSERPFIWYAFRDPALPGNADMVGANLVVAKVKPAYTFAAAISSTRAICDDPRDGVCDRCPCA
jgi:hypothetical protein